MPAIVLAALSGLVSIAGILVGRIAIAIGVGVVSYTGLSVLLDSLKAQVISSLGNLPSTAIAVMGLMQVDVIISILFSAVAARLLLNGLTGGALKRIILK